MSKTARLEVAIYMLEERIKSLEGSLREIRDIAKQVRALSSMQCWQIKR